MGNENPFQIKIWRYILFALACSLAFSFSFASGLASFNPGDSILLPAKEHKLNREQFLEKYGRDDSSRAFINFYFETRKKSGKMIWVSLILMAVLTTIIGIVAATYPETQYTGTYDDIGTAVLIVFFGGGLYATFALVIVGIIRTLMYSRKKLLRILRNYFDGHSLPPRITRSKVFARLMQVERKMSHPRVSPEFYLHE